MAFSNCSDRHMESSIHQWVDGMFCLLCRMYNTIQPVEPKIPCRISTIQGHFNCLQKLLEKYTKIFSEVFIFCNKNVVHERALLNCATIHHHP